MISASFVSSTQRLKLEACVRRQREDHGIARRAHAILLLDDGKSCQTKMAPGLFEDPTHLLRPRQLSHRHEVIE
jgi:hypothetical protein